MLVAVSIASSLVLSSCSDAMVASVNLSKEADNFQVYRRVVFYNGITGEYMLEMKGFLSIETNDTARRLEVTCKTENGFKKHFLGLSDNVTYVCEQLEPLKVGDARYEVNFKPSAIIPDVRLR